MAARSSWKGFLKLSLVSVPVKAYTASSSEGAEVKLNQLHKECNSRIQYKKVCPIHGEIPSDQIVSGYEYSKGQYVIIDTDDLSKLRTEDEKAITIDSFVTPDEIDPMYWGKSYYLVPDGPLGLKPFTVLRQAMVDAERYAVGQIVLHNKEQIVLIRPIENLLGMSILSYETQVTRPSTFADEAPSVEATKEELDLAKMLVAAATPKKFDLGKYKDEYTAKLTELIEAKVAGKEVVAPPVHHETQIINLMDALKASVAQAKAASGEVEEEKPGKKMAPSTRGRAAGGGRKRKSS